ncbi:MAG: hypothetical protein A2Y24_04285 [Clostridiales bacterium GWE2_32_10]|nr:MAG: hypothetical protein A2Y24_04285 [Clostridiales bacterium GWE2_32_10]
MYKYLNIVYAGFVLLFSIMIFSYPTNVFNACKFGLVFWYNSIIPSLFPFMVITSLILESKLILTIVHTIFSGIMQALFRISGVGAIPVILGMFCGYPIGAKLTSDLYDKKAISLIEAEKLVSFCNNCGPIFIISVVCMQLLGDIAYAPFIIIVQILSALSVGVIFRNYKKNVTENTELTHPTSTNTPKKSISMILNDSIVTSAYNTINIGSFIIFYSVVLEIFMLSGIMNAVNILFLPIESFLHIGPILSGKLAPGLIELSTGVNNIANNSGSIPQKILLINIIINWGGFSVHSQTNNIIQKSNISFKPYIIGKLLQSVFSIIYTILLSLF